MAARFAVRVQPGARRGGLTGWYGDLPRVAVTAPPVDGAATAAVLAVLAEALGVRERQLRVVSGHTARTKVVEVEGLDDGQVRQRLLAAVPGGTPGVRKNG